MIVYWVTMTAKSSFLSVALVASLSLLACLPDVGAADVKKADNNTALNLVGSWVGGSVPGTGDIALWDSTVTTANATSMGTSGGGDLSFAGIKVTNPGGTVSITGNTANLTLGASGIDLTGSADLVLGTSNTAQSLILGADQTWNIGTGRTLAIRYQWAVSGTANLTIQGSGTLHFETVGSSSRPFGTGTLTLGGSGGLSLTRATSTGQVTLNNAVALSGDIALVNSAYSISTTRAYRFTGGLDIGSATRSLTLSNTDSTYDPAIDSRYAAVVDFDSSVTGTGTLNLINGNTGANAGKAIVAYSDAVGSIGVSNLRIGSKVEFYLGASWVLTNATAVTVDTNGVLSMSRHASITAYNQTIKSLAGSGTVGNISEDDPSVRASTLIIDGGVTTGTTTFSGNIIDNTIASNRTLALTKNGSNTQILSGINTYTGATTVNSGSLIINGSLGNTAVAVNSGGTLGGNGTIGGATSINNGGTLSAGNSPGTLTFGGNLTLAGGAGPAGATAVFEGGDLVAVTGTLTLNNDWNLTLLTGYKDGGTVTLFTYGTAGGTMDITPDIDISGLGFTPGGALTLTDNGSSIILNGISVIPEPGTLALIGLGLGVALMTRRSRKREQKS